MSRNDPAPHGRGVSQTQTIRPQQLTLSEIERGFAACGIKELPQGVSELNRREMLFVQRLLEHGQQRRAAIEAGYSETSADSTASFLLRKPKVFAFYRRCTEGLANDAGTVVRTTFERYVVFNAKAQNAAQERADADTWLAKEFSDEDGKNAKQRTKYEQLRARAQRDEKLYSGLARAEGTLLAALLGKLKIKIEGELKFSVVTDEDREHLMQLEAAGVPVRMPQMAGGRN
ncbi:MAG TPA: hypothetical protein DDZ88_25425 [Verrucomicrobiales bacterium]|nr:hypothetical protein [Verrucomicrobiales bacterium]